MANITTVDELFENAGSGSHTIAAGTYDLSAKTGGGANLVLKASLVPTGEVIIDGADTYKVQVVDASPAIGDPTLTHRLTITQGVDNCCEVLATSLAASPIFHYVDFTEAQTMNGLTLQGALAASCVVTCNSCRAYNNDNDGFSILDTATGNAAKLKLVNCESYGNDPLASGGASGDGVTSHLSTHMIELVGGSYHDNGKGGAIIVGGGTLFIDGATFYDNCKNVTGNNHISVGTDGMLFIKNIHMYLTAGATANSKSGQFIQISGGCVYIGDSVIDMTNMTAVYCILLNDGLDAATLGVCIERNIFKNGPASKYGISVPDSPVRGLIQNNTFYNNNRDINLDSPNVTITKNIFHNTQSYAIRAYANEYSSNPHSGNNVFFGKSNPANHFYLDSIKASDLTVDPRLDTQLRTNSPVLWTSGHGAWKPTFPTEAVGARALRNRTRVSTSEIGL